MIPGFAFSFKENLVGIPLMVLGALVDLVKAPVVYLVYLGHKLFDLGKNKRIRKLVAHFFNPKAKGKTLRTRKRYLRLIVDSMYMINYRN